MARSSSREERRANGAGRVAEATPDLPIDPQETARAAGLRYSSDDQRGYRRVRSGAGFAYYDPDGRLVRDPALRRRFASLAIPPAWTDVWICPGENCHLQATGRDARGRKQYRYHPRWIAARNQVKYERLLIVGETLPTLRRQVERDLSARGLPKRKVVALVLRLLQETYMRIGNPEYARQNESYGLTTLRSRHVAITGSKLRVTFRGKSGKHHDILLRNRRVARLVRQLQELPGQELFRYVDEDGGVQTIDSQDVNDYLREVTGQPLTAKDLRTWGGTVLAAEALWHLGAGESVKERERNVVAAVKAVSRILGNTPAVCRKYYVHSGLLQAYIDAELLRILEPCFTGRYRAPEGLEDSEAAVLAFLRARAGEAVAVASRDAAAN